MFFLNEIQEIRLEPVAKLLVPTNLSFDLWNGGRSYSVPLAKMLEKSPLSGDDDLYQSIRVTKQILRIRQGLFRVSWALQLPWLDQSQSETLDPPL